MAGRSPRAGAQQDRGQSRPILTRPGRCQRWSPGDARLRQADLAAPIHRGGEHTRRVMRSSAFFLICRRDAIAVLAGIKVKRHLHRA
jgi:hypothetical protein